VTKNWKQLASFWTVSVGLDLALAHFIAGSSDAFVGTLIVLLLLPVAVAFKFALVRSVVWFRFGKKALADEFYDELIRNKWPKPDLDGLDDEPEDYLKDIVENPATECSARIRAASWLGRLEALFEQNQMVAAFFWRSAFRTALNRYATV